MSNVLVETFPVLHNEVHYKIAKLRQALQDGVFDEVHNPLNVMKEKYEIENDEILENIKNQEERTQKNSANVEGLYELAQIISNEMKFVLQPNFTGKIRHDNVIQHRIDNYYEIGIKKFARQIRIYIDSLIQVDGFPTEMFGDYRRLENLILKTDGVQSEEFLLRLLNLSRQIIPPNLFTENSFVVDSNAVDPTRVFEA